MINSAFKKSHYIKDFNPVHWLHISKTIHMIWLNHLTSFHSMSIWCNRANRYLKVIKTVNFVKRDAFFSMLPFCSKKDLIIKFISTIWSPCDWRAHQEGFSMCLSTLFLSVVDIPVVEDHIPLLKSIYNKKYFLEVPKCKQFKIEICIFIIIFLSKIGLRLRISYFVWILWSKLNVCIISSAFMS